MLLAGKDFYIEKDRYDEDMDDTDLIEQMLRSAEKKELLLTEDAVTETSIRETGYGLAEWEPGVADA